jgi:AcrR family transcriptional regulator
MARPTTASLPRERLSRDRILQAAIAQADAGGLDGLSMRTLADRLGMAPMALYRHISNKDDLIDGMVDVVFSEIDVPASDQDWRAAMRRRAISVRDALARHPWAVGLLESRATPGPANLRHHDAMIGTLLAAGFDMPLAAHAYALMDSYIYGFALTKLHLPFESTADIADVAHDMLEPFPADAYPNLAAFITEHAMQPGYDFADEFEFGLDVVLDGLERIRSGR